MNEAAYICLHIMSGWLGGKSYTILMRARAAGKFEAIHWALLVISLVAGMLFAKIVIGKGALIKKVPESMAIIAAVSMLFIFVWASGLLRADSRQ